MLKQLQNLFPAAFRHEVDFPPAKDGHGMIGSGMFVTNPPYGIENAAVEIANLYKNG